MHAERVSQKNEREKKNTFLLTFLSTSLFYIIAVSSEERENEKNKVVYTFYMKTYLQFSIPVYDIDKNSNENVKNVLTRRRLERVY